jgi:RNA polymerase-interacting CarD/CdnL/TRCF family regulator
VVTVIAVRTPGRRERAEKQEEPPSAGGTIASSSDLKAGDRVVYPKQGVYRVTGLEQKDIAGQRLEFVKMTREENGASVLVPLGKVATIGLRRVASADDIEGVFHYLGATYDDPELDWKVRHRDNVERLIAGGVLGVAEVVKGLHSLSRLRPLPAKERELYDSSRHLLVNEISVSLDVPDVIAEDYIDFALMPPAGVKLPLKPPPTPVELKGPPWKRKKPTASEDDDDLGLAELGIDLRAIEGAGAGEAEESEESEEGEEKKPAGEDEEDEGVPVKAPPPKKGAKPAPVVKPPAPAAKPHPPAKKAAPAPKAPPPAKKAATPAKKAAPPPPKKAPPAKKASPAKKPAPKKAAPAKKPARPAKGKKK